VTVKFEGLRKIPKIGQCWSKETFDCVKISPAGGLKKANTNDTNLKLVHQRTLSVNCLVFYRFVA